jgi:hypothetical protein
MKVQAILEFDLEDRDGAPIDDRELFERAAEDADHAVRMRLMGASFIETDVLIRTWTLRVSVLDPSKGDAGASG